jgi:hypothetical protein
MATLAPAGGFKDEPSAAYAAIDSAANASAAKALAKVFMV